MIVTWCVAGRRLTPSIHRQASQQSVSAAIKWQINCRIMFPVFPLYHFSPTFFIFIFMGYLTVPSVSKSIHIASDDRVIDESWVTKGCGLTKVLLWLLLERTEENHVKPQDTWCSSQGLNWVPSKEKSRTLPLGYPVWCSWTKFCVSLGLVRCSKLNEKIIAI
jgi:hypothetical protein